MKPIVNVLKSALMPEVTDEELAAAFDLPGEFRTA